MKRALSKEEREQFIKNRTELHEQLTELQADLEDMADEEFIECRSCLRERVNCCMRLILETDEDNIE